MKPRPVRNEAARPHSGPGGARGGPGGDETPIRLKDLLPKREVKGGRKSLFGTRELDGNGADGPKRED